MKCQYCQQNTAGHHEQGCPNNPVVTVSAGFIPEHTCPDCARLKALCGELWEIVKDLEKLGVCQIAQSHRPVLEQRLRQEGIV